ncbi:MAG: hypothetical protein M3N04_08190, partial [Actinomycetota bacterium]|nr:hypothetical protein [Actinomycetota bacterium]
QLSITRARITRRSQRLELVAPITRLASGSARVEMLVGGRRTRFRATIDSKRGQLRINRAITRQQARRQSAIVTISYLGNSRTLPKQVRLRAASRAARLTARKPTLKAGRLVTKGTVAKAARGVVRLELAYKVDGRNVVRKLSAKIKNGRWTLSSALSPRIAAEIARRSGSVGAYVLYTGYGPASIGGEMRFYKVLGAR